MTKALATYFATLQDTPGTEYKVEILEDGPIKKIAVNGKTYNVDYKVSGNILHSLIMDHKSYAVRITGTSNTTYEVERGDYFQLEVINELTKIRQSRTQSVATGRQVITAQMPGVIQHIHVRPGVEVKAGTPICVLVAMKMENEIKSPIDGTVKEVYINPNDKVAVGDKMMVIE